MVSNSLKTIIALTCALDEHKKQVVENVITGMVLAQTAEQTFKEQKEKEKEKEKTIA